MNRVSAPVAPLSRYMTSRSTASRSTAKRFAAWKYSSIVDESLPQTASPKYLDFGLQVCTIMASNCIFNLARFRASTASLGHLTLGLQLHLQTHMISVSKCIFEFIWSPPAIACSTITVSKSIFGFTRSRPPSASRISLHYRLQVCTIMASQVDLQTGSISACKFAQSWPASASPFSHDYGLQVDLCVCTLPASKWISKLAPSQRTRLYLGSLDPGIQVHLHNDCITAFKFAQLWPPTESPLSHNYGLQVHLWFHYISVSMCITMLSQSASSGGSLIVIEYRLQADLLYIYILSQLDRHYIPYYYVPNLVTERMINIIDEMPCGYGILRIAAVIIWHQVSHKACIQSSAASELSRRPALRARHLSKSPADLHRGLTWSILWPSQ